MLFKDYLKQEQSTWNLIDWLYWYWIGIEIRWEMFWYRNNLKRSTKKAIKKYGRILRKLSRE